MKNFLISLFLVIMGVMIFGLAFRGVPGNPRADVIAKSIADPIRPFGTSPDRGRYLLTQNLVENHTFALTRAQADASAPDVGYYKGNFYLLYPPGVAILAIPFYIIGAHFNLAYIFTHLMAALFSIANLIFIYFISRRILKLPYWASIFSSLIFGFGSIAMSYATTLFQHQETVFFMVSAFYAVYQYKIHEKLGFLWGCYVWFAYALAILIDYPNALIMLPIMIYFLVVSLKIEKTERKFNVKLRSSLIFTSIFFVAITFAHGYYNDVNFGGWTKLSGSLASYLQGVQNILDQNNNTQSNAEINAIEASKDLGSFFTEKDLVNSGYELLFAPDKGIFIFNPIFILGFLGIFYAFKKMDLEKGILASIVAINLLLYSSWGDPWGGWAFGPRYLIPSIAILSIFVPYFLVSDRFKLTSKIIAFILFVFSSAVSVMGSLTTNAVPPKVEALPLKSKYGFFYNVDFLKNGQTNSFTYTYFFKNHLTLIEYYYIILGIILIASFLVLFILPLFEKNESIDINK